MIKIQSIDGNTLFEGDFVDLRTALEAAVKARAYLSRADLSRADLSGADLSGADLSGAYLSRADLSRAYLSRADLSGADLSGADLSRADLSGANLSEADLSRADLSGADLSEATGFNPNRTDALRMLRDQPGKIRAYKLVTAEGMSPMAAQQGGVPIKYEIGKVVEVKADESETLHCSRGVNLCDMTWAMRNWATGQRILICEFTAKDIAAIPHGTDGKFRVHRCEVVGEKDLAEIGLIEGPSEPKRSGKRKGNR